MTDYSDDLRRQLSKRTLLRGMGAAGLVGLGGNQAWAAGSYFGPEYAVDPNTTFDVIVIGAGTAGMPLALWASARGEVLVIERGPDVGGTLFLSGGMMSAAGTNLQKRMGIKGTPDMHYSDTMHMGHGKAMPDVTRLYVNNAADTINWLEDIGMKYPEGQPLLGVHAEFPTRRYHGGAKGGLSILEALKPGFAKAEAAGKIRVLLRTGAVELVKDRNGAVTGVIAQDESGVRTQYRAATSSSPPAAACAARWCSRSTTRRASSAAPPTPTAKARASRWVWPRAAMSAAAISIFRTVARSSPIATGRRRTSRAPRWTPAAASRGKSR